MIRLVVGFVAGYVLGSKAGRERYEQIIRLSSKAADHPAVQGAAGFVRAKISGIFSSSKKSTRPDMAYLDPEPRSVNGSLDAPVFKPTP